MRHVKNWFSSYGAVLALRDVRLLFSGLIVSATGSWAYNVALLALVYGRTHSLAWVGAAGFVRFLPSLLLSPYSGVVVERADRFRLLFFTNLGCMVWQCGLATVALTHGPIVLALAFAGLSASTATFEMPAVSATVPTLVSETELVAANALQSRSTTSSSSSARRSVRCCCWPARPRSCSSSTPARSQSPRSW